MIETLTRPKTLWVTFGLTLMLTLCFGIVMLIWQFAVIDEMYVAHEIRSHIEAMSSKQKFVHAWMTGTLDVVYPFVYGAFFVGVAHSSFGRFSYWLALPSVLVIPVDLIEGFAQIMLLNDNFQYMDLKTTVTPIKLLLFLTGLAITVIGLVLKLRKP